MWSENGDNMRTQVIIMAVLVAIAVFAAAGMTASDAVAPSFDGDGIVAESEELIIDEDATIRQGESLTVEGLLVVSEGATLMIEDGGKLRVTATGAATIDGALVCGNGEPDNETVMSDSESFVVNGTAAFDGDDSVSTPSEKQLVINGTATIGTNDNSLDLLVAEGGEVTVGNTSVFMDCYGTAVIDTGDHGGISIVDLHVGGTVLVESLSKLMLLAIESPNDESDLGNVVSLMGGGGFTVESLVDEDGKKILTLSGEFRPDDIASALVYGNVHIGDLLVYPNSSIDVVNGGNVCIDGDVVAPGNTLRASASERGLNTITVNGSLTTDLPLDLTYMELNAAEYTDADGRTVYVPLEAAVASGAESITVHGENSIDDPSSLSGVSVITAEGATIAFGERGGVSSEDSGYLVVIAVLAIAVVILACTVARTRRDEAD